MPNSASQGDIRPAATTGPPRLCFKLIYYLVAVSGPKPDRLRGVLAVSGIESVVKDGHLSARLSATTAEKALARVKGALRDEAVSLDQPIPESL